MYRKNIQKSIDYIENNLKSEFTVEELSEIAGFSLFHFYRLFRTAVGMPVMQYVARRRLLHGIYEIECGRLMIDVALDYGFSTYAGFYKAFVREFGCTPVHFTKMYKVKKPYRIHLFEEEHIMVTHKKITELLKHWELQDETVRDIFYEGTGNRNENAYYVGEDYVIKFSPNLGKLKNSIDISKKLADVGLVAATPILSTDGEEYIADGELYFCVTKRIKGKQMQPGTMYEGDYKEKARYIGEIIGQLDRALENADVLVNDANTYESVVNWAIPQLEGKIDLPKELLDNYKNDFWKAYQAIPRQVIHRDPNPGNIILAEEQWGFIDFELSERNVRIFDPCYAATAILSESFAEGDAQKLIKWVDIYKNIIYGYDAVVRLTDEEKGAVPYVVLSNQLLATAWFSDKEKFKELYEVNKKMTEWIAGHVEELAIE